MERLSTPRTPDTFAPQFWRSGLGLLMSLGLREQVASGENEMFFPFFLSS